MKVNMVRAEHIIYNSAPKVFGFVGVALDMQIDCIGDNLGSVESYKVITSRRASPDMTRCLMIYIFVEVMFVFSVSDEKIKQ